MDSCNGAWCTIRSDEWDEWVFSAQTPLESNNKLTFMGWEGGGDYGLRPPPPPPIADHPPKSRNYNFF